MNAYQNWLADFEEFYTSIKLLLENQEYQKP